MKSKLKELLRRRKSDPDDQTSATIETRRRALGLKELASGQDPVIE